MDLLTEVPSMYSEMKRSAAAASAGGPGVREISTAITPPIAKRKSKWRVIAAFDNFTKKLLDLFYG
jgi:hypothetical protein